MEPYTLMVVWGWVSLIGLSVTALMVLSQMPAQNLPAH